MLAGVRSPLLINYADNCYQAFTAISTDRIPRMVTSNQICRFSLFTAAAIAEEHSGKIEYSEKGKDHSR